MRSNDCQQNRRVEGRRRGDGGRTVWDQQVWRWVSWQIGSVVCFLSWRKWRKWLCKQKLIVDSSVLPHSLHVDGLDNRSSNIFVTQNKVPLTASLISKTKHITGISKCINFQSPQFCKTPLFRKLNILLKALFFLNYMYANGWSVPPPPKKNTHKKQQQQQQQQKLTLWCYWFQSDEPALREVNQVYWSYFKNGKNKVTQPNLAVFQKLWQPPFKGILV